MTILFRPQCVKSLTMSRSTLVLQVNYPEGNPPSNYHRIFWCPYIPEDLSTSSASLNSSDDPGKQLMVTHGHMVSLLTSYQTCALIQY